jgi:cysteine synthase
VVAASAGNHAQGVALAAKQRGLRATIVMPLATPDIKVSAVKRLGAEVGRLSFALRLYSQSLRAPRSARFRSACFRPGAYTSASSTSF